MSKDNMVQSPVSMTYYCYDGGRLEFRFSSVAELGYFAAWLDEQVNDLTRDLGGG